MKKLFYLFTILFAIAFAACDNGQPEGPSGDSNVPEKPSSPTTGSFVAKPFSVSATKTVTFSPGNLQYHPANDEWRFAPNQTDYIGKDNANISPTYNGWIDLFGWGTGNNPTNKGSVYEDYQDYQTFVDWGVNQIGSYAPHTWRTLIYEEWYYLCYERPNYDKLIGIAQVNGVNGLILLPDNWTCPSGVTFKSGFTDKWCSKCIGNYQTISASDWSKLEASGAVFLPAAGSRVASDVDFVQSYGYYWSASEYAMYEADLLFFASGEMGMRRYNRDDGRSVRLVTTLVSPQEPNKPSDPSTPEEPSNPLNPSNPSDSEEPSNPNNTPLGFVAKPFSVSATKTVTFSPGNLQYHPANNEWRFAPSQLDYIGNDNVNISATYNGWIDLFGWGTGNNPTNASIDDEDYPTFVDWGVNQIGSYAPNTWRTLTYAEWDYLIDERPNYDKLIGVAQVNGVNGLILLPDNWTCPSGVTFELGFYYYSSTESYAACQTFSSSDWAKLEASGAVFLPAAGSRVASDVSGVQRIGYYWSPTEYDLYGVFSLYFYSYGAYMENNIRCDGFSVRLVQD